MDSSEISQLKSLLRGRLRKALSRMPRGKRIQKSKRIAEKVIKTLVFRRARKILIYASLPEEVQTRELILKSLALGKRVYLPAVHPRTRKISIFQISNPKSDLKKGYRGILEPRQRRKGRPEELDLILVPGLGFDRKGGRLGRGEGNFDRFLMRTSKAAKIGLAFREQMLPRIPKALHDIHMDKVITD